MSIQIWEQYKSRMRNELDRCLDFWLSNGMDDVNGGVYTCLDREGKVFSTDKSVWMQGRTAWTFAHLCHVYGSRPEWLRASESCLNFLERYCINREADGRLYFTVTADGKPLRQRRYFFSEAFYILANAEYARAAGSEEHLLRARRVYDFVSTIQRGLMTDPTGIGEKTISGTRKTYGLADPMITLNVSQVMRRCDPARTEVYDRRAAECIEAIRRQHKPELRCTLETVGENGAFLDSISAGRIVNPGHSMECSWFLMDEAKYRNDDALYATAVEMFDFALARGWDESYGGLLYYVDVLGRPPEAYEHDMKLWWPHNEAVIASLKIYRDTKKAAYFDWFEKIFAYCEAHFRDAEYGEWYGYLRRDGKPTEPPCKGSTFKGPFHLPRMLIMAEQLLGELIALESSGAVKTEPLR